MSKRIKVIITDDGMNMETSGFAGKACLKEAQEVTDGMRGDGLDVTMQEWRPKAEMKQPIAVEGKVDA